MKNNNNSQKGRKKRNHLLFLMIGILLIIIGIAIFLFSYLKSEGYLGGSKKFGVIDEDVLVHMDPDSIPEDALFITRSRREYEDGTLRLVVPTLSVDTPIGDSTVPKGLEEKAGLYEVSQMPGEKGGNVSIAGHREIHDKVFYYLDEVEEGDYMYLVYQNTVFQYLFHSSSIMNPDDWSVIQRQGFDALTLTTCDPIGTTWYRLIVTGQLVDSFPYDSSYDFPATASDE